MTDEVINPPTDEPGEQPTPDADAFMEMVGAGAALIGGGAFNLSKAANALAASLTQGGTGWADRYMTSSFKDTDIGMDEVIRGSLAAGFQSLIGKRMVLDHVETRQAQLATTIDHMRNSDDAFYGGLKKATSTHAAGLLDAFGLETDNEVLSTVALSKVVQGLANRIAGIEEAILAGMEKAK